MQVILQTMSNTLMQTPNSSRNRWPVPSILIRIGLLVTISFSASLQASTTLDKVHSYPGTLQGAAGYTSTGGGHTGVAGDYGMELTANNGWISADGSFMNVAGTNNTASIAFWAKNHLSGSTDCNSAFQVLSASASRGLEAHVPCDGVVYYDTS